MLKWTKTLRDKRQNNTRKSQIKKFAQQSFEEKVISCDLSPGIYQILFHPSRPLLFALSSDQCTVWHTESGELAQRFYRKMPTCITIHNNGEWLLIAGSDNQVDIWDIFSGKLVTSVLLPDEGIAEMLIGQGNSFIYYDAIMHGRCRSMKENSVVASWDFEANQPLWRMPITKNSRLQNIAYHENTNRLAISFYPAKIEIWNIDSQTIEQELQSFNYYTCGMSFTPDGKYLISCHKYAGYGEIRIWDMENFSYRTLNKNRHSFGLAVSGNSRYLVVSGGFHYNEVYIFDLPSNNDFHAYSFEGHGFGVYNTAINHDGSVIAFCSNNIADHIPGRQDFTLKIYTKI